MDENLRITVEMNEFVWSQLKKDLTGLRREEVLWRPSPDANNINLIVRHLRIESEWQVNSIERGDPMDDDQSLVNRVGFDYEDNLRNLHALGDRFITALRKLDKKSLREQNERVYGEIFAKHGISKPDEFLSFHHPVHLAMHWGQIRTLRTLYRKAIGEAIPPELYPGNPSYPQHTIDKADTHHDNTKS